MAFEMQIPTLLFVMREEIKLLFHKQNNLKFQELSSDDEWVAKLANLSDVFSLLN